MLYKCKVVFLVSIMLIDDEINLKFSVKNALGNLVFSDLYNQQGRIQCGYGEAGLQSNPILIQNVIFLCKILDKFGDIVFTLNIHSLTIYLKLLFNGHYENTPIRIYRKFRPQKLKIFR